MTAPDLMPLEDDDLAALAAALRGMPHVSDQLAYWIVQALCAVVGEQQWRTEDDHPDPPPWPTVSGLPITALAAIVGALDRLTAQRPGNRQLHVFVQAATAAVLAVVRARIAAVRERQRRQ